MPYILLIRRLKKCSGEQIAKKEETLREILDTTFVHLFKMILWVVGSCPTHDAFISELLSCNSTPSPCYTECYANWSHGQCIGMVQSPKGGLKFVVLIASPGHILCCTRSGAVIITSSHVSFCRQVSYQQYPVYI